MNTCSSLLVRVRLGDGDGGGGGGPVVEERPTVILCAPGDAGSLSVKCEVAAGFLWMPCGLRVLLVLVREVSIKRRQWDFLRRFFCRY